jgi:hypothetical protein
MPKALDPMVIEVLKKYGEDGRTACWDCHGTWVVLHKALERVAVKAKIKFDPPQVLVVDAENKTVAICVNGTMDGRSEWSIGEAAPYNNKNAYPFAMAEKRAKDRVILKLVGLHGLLYSEDEVDDFKATAPAVASAPVDDGLPKVKNAPGVSEARKWVNGYLDEMRNCPTAEAFVELMYGAKTRWIRTCQAYPGLWEGPDGSGLRGEAMKISMIVGARDDFDTFVREVELMARETQAQAAE